MGGVTSPFDPYPIKTSDGGRVAQAKSVELTAIAAVSGTGLLVRTAAGAWTVRSVAAGNGVAVTDGSGVAGNPTVAVDQTYAFHWTAGHTFDVSPSVPTPSPGDNSSKAAPTAFVTAAVVAAGSGYQPLDSDLTAIAALSTTTFGRSLLTQADAAAARSALGAQAAGSYQPLDADLTALAALTTTAFGLAFNTLANGAAALSYIGAQAAGSYQPLDSDLTSIAALTTTSYGRSVLALADSAAALTYFGAQAAGSYQPLATPLTALAGVTPAANTFAYFTSGTAATTAALTAQGRGLLDDVTAADNRVTIGVDQRTGVGDADYTILATDRTVATTAAFTAARTWTLPAASSVNAGQAVVISDDFGTLTTTNTLTIQRAGADTANGATSVVLTRPYRSLAFVSDGVSKWTYDALAKVLDTANTWTAAQSVILTGGTGNQFLVQGEGATTVSVQRFSSNSVSAGISIVKTRGTVAAPSGIAANDDLGLIAFRGHDGGVLAGALNNRLGAQLTATCIAAAPSTTSFETRVILTAVPAGSGTATELARWDHTNGFSLYGTKVVGARQTGFTAATGTASKVTYATYATGTASAAYSQAEMQAVRDALQVVSQQVKALKDALIAHGLIGT